MSETIDSHHEYAPPTVEKRIGLGVGVICGGLALALVTCVAERAIDIPEALFNSGVLAGWTVGAVGSAIAGGAIFTRENNNGGQ